MKLHWTTKGRVVYDRKTNPFTIRDYVRIGKRIGAEIFRITPGIDISLFGTIRSLIVNDPTGTVTVPEYTEFDSGGSFGGAGATREFNKPSYRVMVIIEEI